MRTHTVSFFGHREIFQPRAVEEALEQHIADLLRAHPFVEFLVGRDGEFDQLVSSTVRRCKREYGAHNSSLICVLPYLKAEYRDNEESFLRYYDEVEICAASAQAHYKAAIKIRNRYMVDRSQQVFFCIDHLSGGAYQTMLYAQKQGVPYINLCEDVRPYRF